MPCYLLLIDGKVFLTTSFFREGLPSVKLEVDGPKSGVKKTTRWVVQNKTSRFTFLPFDAAGHECPGSPSTPLLNYYSTIKKKRGKE